MTNAIKTTKAANRAVQEAQWAQEREEKRVAYLATIPKRMMEAQALANKLYVQTEVRLTETGPSVRFTRDNSPYIDSCITYDTDEWELESLEKQLQDIKDEYDAQVARRAVAQAIYDGLTKEQKDALKENIHSLR